MSATAVVAPDSLSAADLAANQQLDRRFTMAIAHKDVDEIMTCFAPGADTVLVTWDGNVVRGWNAIRAIVQRLCTDNDTLNLVINEVTHHAAGEFVIAVGTATWSMKPRSATMISFVERWTDLRRKVGGEWVYVLDHAHALSK